MNGFRHMADGSSVCLLEHVQDTLLNAPGTEVLAGERPAGRLLSVAGDRGLAHLRFDRASGRLTAGAAEITRIEASG